MSWYFILAVFVMFLGAGSLAYQVFKMTALDAASRGLKHPNFWGLFSVGGQNGGGLILYLIGRRKYPSNMDGETRAEMDSRKKKAGVSLIFLTVGAIGFFTICILELS